jgi:GH15 family glucan-1,4-alpha-glucosidase
MSLQIGDYALIGNGRTAALVGRNGSIDWLCLPRFDSPACFAALVGSPENGHWRIAPDGALRRTGRRYRPDSLVLETEFETESGICRLADFMPIAPGTNSIVRIVKGIEGLVKLRMELVMRFDYGRFVPWVSRRSGDLFAVAGRDQLVLRTPVAHHGEELRTVAEFEIRAGETLPFILSHGPSYAAPPDAIDPDVAFEETDRYWRDWAARGNYAGPWREAVTRSLITLKALTYTPTGGTIAAPTTSLPERSGGDRNWDYRYCWLRDATLTLLCLVQAGYREEADAWRSWMIRTVAGLPSQIQPIYGVLGDHRLEEWELPWLQGYRRSLPVRVGNNAYAQRQLDIFGEIIDALHHARRSDLAPSELSWSLEKALMAQLETLQDEPDCGIWEFRGSQQHFTHSKVMIWVAFDRAVSAGIHFGLDGPIGRWREIRDRLHAEICEKAYDDSVGAFVQAQGSRALDAALLLIPLVGFLPADDPRVMSTVEAVGKKLMRGGFMHRYDTRESRDGHSPGEGAFLACSFWFADNLILQGRQAEARRLFKRLLSIRNDVGLLAEEYDIDGGSLLGNFPQALSHIALVGTAYNLAGRGPALERVKHHKDE